jgi:hypothetical protein
VYKTGDKHLAKRNFGTGRTDRQTALTRPSVVASRRPWGAGEPGHLPHPFFGRIPHKANNPVSHVHIDAPESENARQSTYQARNASRGVRTGLFPNETEEAGNGFVFFSGGRPRVHFGPLCHCRTGKWSMETSGFSSREFLSLGLIGYVAKRQAHCLTSKADEQQR